MARRPANCSAKAAVTLPNVGVTNLVCVRGPEHEGSHHDTAWEVYWSGNIAGRMVSVPATDNYLSDAQSRR